MIHDLCLLLMFLTGWEDKYAVPLRNEFGHPWAVRACPRQGEPLQREEKGK